MNTSKSLYEILEHLVHVSLEEGRNGDLAKWYHEYEGDMDWTAFVAKHFPVAEEAKQAIVEAVQGLIPPVSTIGKQFSTSEIDRFAYDFAFNQCREQVLQAIKEWQQHGQS